MTEGSGGLDARLGAWLSNVGSPEAALELLATAEDLLGDDAAKEEPVALWHRYLNETRRPAFLQALPDGGARHRWADTAFAVIRNTGFNLETLFEQRVREHPDRTLFQEMEGREARSWSYRNILERLQTMAALFWATQPAGPRVAILSENSLDSACCDLACLTYDILVTPLNPHFNPEALAWIIDELGINIVVVETEELRDRMDSVRPLARTPFHLFVLEEEAATPGPLEALLGEAMAQLGRAQIDRILSARSRRGLTELATVMFTSGSTGKPKGVQYTLYNLLSKRFARAAALPKVGDGEVLLCFLPLYHTFGRYLEMMGMVFWGGTYVFAGNPSLETLLQGLQEVRPTGLISIPRRWQQIKERCLAGMDSAENRAGREEAFRQVVGDRLRWGLSAAGALEPAAFLFFQRHGVELCSGFGMTEATGGITMTPPGSYEENSVGVPLPGIKARLSEEGELQISGEYVARYLGDPVPVPEDDYWLPTGDIFRLRESGHYEIVDRIKDIYKNSKGQTVAPGAIEQRLAHVPGIARSFLVGDGRDYNVLLIVPDLQDPVLSEGSGSEQTAEYFRQIVSTANQGLAPYERVVNFAVLDRDFERERGELTPKGSFQRKVIEENFRDTIEDLYHRDFVALAAGDLEVRIPRWFFRDLGILEPEIISREGGLLNRRSQRFLSVVARPQTNTVEIGDLEYRITGKRIDLGQFARQPLLWLANPALMVFCPCKEGWDLPLKDVSAQVFIPWRQEGDVPQVATVTPTAIRDPSLLEVNRLCTTALYGSSKDALGAIRSLEAFLKGASLRMNRAIHRRLGALARHPDLSVRTLAYRIFLLIGPVPDYTKELPTFLFSGLPFLSEDSIEEIANSKLERFRLDALRVRLQRYRTQLEWPAPESLRTQMDGVFSLLGTFVRRRPAFYPQVRAELVSWVLHRSDPVLAESARGHLEQLVEWFEGHLAATTPDNDAAQWEGKIVFQDRISQEEIRTLRKALVGTTFLKQSIVLAYEDRGVEVWEIPLNGIWIAQVFSILENRVYRMAVNTRDGKHYDLLLGTATDREEASVLETTYWMLALGGRRESPPVVRQFGCYRPELGAFSMALVNDLTVWERVRELSGEGFVEFHPTRRHWRNLFVRGLAAFFLAWRLSDGRIVPGPVSPANVMVPAPDFRAGGTILALAGIQPYAGPLSLVGPMLKNFFFPTVSYYPQVRNDLDIAWLFDAAVEALGVEEGRGFLQELMEVIASEGVPEPDPGWDLAEKLTHYLKRLENEYRVPLALQCAVERYQEWDRSNPRATSLARERQIGELHRLYRLETFGDLGRYTLYRRTYFAGLAPEVTAAFDRLLKRMFRNQDLRPTHMIELSDLQATLVEEADRMVFSHMVFPTARRMRPVDVLAVGDEEREQVVLRSKVLDRRGDTYVVREPIEPAEIGRLYRLYLDSGMPLSLSDQAEYLLAIDGEDRIVGGICYKILEAEVALLDGLVITAPLRGNGLGGELVEDFSVRMRTLGIRIINTHYISRPFLRAHGFQLDEEWGGLVKFLDGEVAREN